MWDTGAEELRQSIQGGAKKPTRKIFYGEKLNPMWITLKMRCPLASPFHCLWWDIVNKESNWSGLR